MKTKKKYKINKKGAHIATGGANQNNNKKVQKRDKSGNPNNDVVSNKRAQLINSLQKKLNIQKKNLAKRAPDKLGRYFGPKNEYEKLERNINESQKIINELKSKQVAAVKFLPNYVPNAIKEEIGYDLLIRELIDLKVITEREAQALR